MNPLRTNPLRTRVPSFIIPIFSIYFPPIALKNPRVGWKILNRFFSNGSAVTGAIFWANFIRGAKDRSLVWLDCTKMDERVRSCCSKFSCLFKKKWASQMVANLAWLVRAQHATFSNFSPWIFCLHDQLLDLHLNWRNRFLLDCKKADNNQSG